VKRSSPGVSTPAAHRCAVGRAAGQVGSEHQRVYSICPSIVKIGRIGDKLEKGYTPLFEHLPETGCPGEAWTRSGPPGTERPRSRHPVLIQRQYSHAPSSSQETAWTAPESSSAIRRLISIRHASSTASSARRPRFRSAGASGPCAPPDRASSPLQASRAGLATGRFYHSVGGAVASLTPVPSGQRSRPAEAV
jgi:hypothetical protein